MLSDYLHQQLVDLVDGQLAEDERAQLEVELQGNAELAEEYRTLLELRAASREWEEQPVPSWSRLAGVTRPPAYHSRPWLAWTSLAASLTVAILLILQVQFTLTSDGFTLKFNATVKSEALADELAARVVALEDRQMRLLDERLKIQDQRTQAANQKLLAAALSFSRNERRQDMQRLATHWSRVRAGDQRLVGGLVRSQYDDRIAIRNLYKHVPQ